MAVDDKAAAQVSADTATDENAVAGAQGSYSLAGAGQLKLEIGNGQVAVVTAPAGSSPEAVWTITKAKAVNAAPEDSLQLEFSQEGGRLLVKDKYNGPKLSSRPQLKLSLSVPAGCDLDASLGNGSLSIESGGKLRADVGNGSLSLKGEYSASEVSVGNGSVDGSLMLLLGEHKFSVGNGGVKLKLDPAGSVSFDASTGMGQISLGGLPGSVERQMMSQTASGSLGSGAARLSVDVGNGGVQLSS